MTDVQSDAARQLAEVQTLIAGIDQSADPTLRPQVERIVRIILDLHKDGLRRIIDRLSSAGAAGESLLAAFADDEIVASLLQLYDLHPVGVDERIRRALQGVRPFLQSHGGEVELLGIDEGAVRLRMHGHCDGCAAFAESLKLAIEKAVYEAAPEVGEVCIETAAQPATSPGAP
jgi:Fe-S cluster biogenesis protein NfuA